nr:hypothetical protein [Serinicoccus marinus]
MVRPLQPGPGQLRLLLQDDRPEDQEEDEDGADERHDLDQLDEQQRDDEVPPLEAGDAGVGGDVDPRVRRQGDLGGLHRGAAAGALEEVGVDGVVGPVDLLRQPDELEDDPDAEQQQDDQPVRGEGQAGAHLPGLGVDEEEGDEEQQQRQRPHRGADEQRGAAHRAAQREGEDRPRVQSGRGIPEGGEDDEREPDRGGSADLLRHPAEGAAQRGGRQQHERRQREEVARPQGGAGRGPLAGHEVGQAVGQEPALGLAAGIGGLATSGHRPRVGG